MLEAEDFLLSLSLDSVKGELCSGYALYSMNSRHAFVAVTKGFELRSSMYRYRALLRYSIASDFLLNY